MHWFPALHLRKYTKFHASSLCRRQWSIGGATGGTDYINPTFQRSLVTGEAGAGWCCLQPKRWECSSFNVAHHVRAWCLLALQNATKYKLFWKQCTPELCKNVYFSRLEQTVCGCVSRTVRERVKERERESFWPCWSVYCLSAISVMFWMSRSAITEKQSRLVGLEGTFKGSRTTEGAERQRDRHGSE